MLKLYGIETMIEDLTAEDLGELVKKLNAELQGEEYVLDEKNQRIWHAIRNLNNESIRKAKYYRTKKGAKRQ